MRNTIRIDGKLYIRDKDSPNEPLLDYIGNMKPIAVNKAILVNGRIYNIASIYNWQKQGKRTDPFDRESIEKYVNDIIDHYNIYSYGKLTKEIAKKIKNQTKEEKKEELKKFENQLNSYLIEEKRYAESDKRRYKEYQKTPIKNWMIRRIIDSHQLRNYPRDYHGPDNPKTYQNADIDHYFAMKYRQKQDIIDKGNKVYGPLHSITRDREKQQKIEKFNQKYGSIGKKG